MDLIFKRIKFLYMTFEEMEKLKKEIYGDKPVTTENSRRTVIVGPIVPIDQFFSDMSEEERESYSGPKVIRKIELPKVKAPCAHDWGNPEDDWNGVYKCKKCGKYSA